MHNIVVQKLFKHEDEIRNGLMFDENPFDSPDVVALFVFPTPKTSAMWMRNTPRALDMIFIREDHTVACLHENALPYDERRIECGELVLYVVEALTGYIHRKRMKVGDKVIFSSYIRNSFTVP